MPRQKSLLTVIRELVEQEVRSAMQSLLTQVPRFSLGLALLGAAEFRPDRAS